MTAHHAPRLAMEDQKSGAEAIIKQLEGIQINEVAASGNPSAGALSAAHANSADVNDESTDRASRENGSQAKESVVDKPASAPRVRALSHSRSPTLGPAVGGK